MALVDDITLLITFNDIQNIERTLAKLAGSSGIRKPSCTSMSARLSPTRASCSPTCLAWTPWSPWWRRATSNAVAVQARPSSHRRWRRLMSSTAYRPSHLSGQSRSARVRAGHLRINEKKGMGQRKPNSMGAQSPNCAGGLESRAPSKDCRGPGGRAVARPIGAGAGCGA